MGKSPRVRHRERRESLSRTRLEASYDSFDPARIRHPHGRRTDPRLDTAGRVRPDGPGTTLAAAGAATTRAEASRPARAGDGAGLRPQGPHRSPGNQGAAGRAALAPERHL